MQTGPEWYRFQHQSHWKYIEKPCKYYLIHIKFPYYPPAVLDVQSVRIHWSSGLGDSVSQTIFQRLVVLQPGNKSRLILELDLEMRGLSSCFGGKYSLLEYVSIGNISSKRTVHLDALQHLDHHGLVDGAKGSILLETR